MTYIVFSLIGLAALLAVRKNGSPLKQIIFVCLAIAVGCILYLIVDILVIQDDGAIAKGVADKIPRLEIGLYVTMLLGMASKYLYDAIGEKNRKKIKFNKWQFIKPFLVSPMIFAIVYTMIPGSPSIALLLIFSYQNGFFWQTILYKKEQSAGDTSM